MNILFLSRWFPYPTNNGSKLRIYNLLRGLSRQHELTLLSFADQPDAVIEAPEILDVCSKVRVISWKEFDPDTTRARLAIFNLTPRSLTDTFSHEMSDAITDILNEKKYDLIIASQLQMAAYHPYFQDIPAIFEELEIGLFHDLAFSSGGKKRFRHALTWFKLRVYLARLLDSFQACTVVSERERQLLVRNFPKFNRVVEIIPNCLEMDDYKNKGPEKRANTLIFTGPFEYRVNYEAMLWFIGKVFPLILEKVPDAQLIISGEYTDLPLPSLKNITLTGYVDDIKTLVASCSVSIAPLLSGGGTRLKILEAMALDTPVIATSKGAEGLDAIHDKHLLIADSPVEYAECVIKLLNDEGVRLQLAEKARLLVQEKYNWTRVISDYLRLINTVVK